MVEVADLRRQLAEAAAGSHAAAAAARGTATVANHSSSSSSRTAAAAAVVYVIDPAVTDELERLHALVSYHQPLTPLMSFF
jgi:phosphohistidine swiveling domain-containing protein